MSEAWLAELQQKAGELEAALRQVRGELARLDAIKEDVEDLFAELDERAAPDAPMHVKYRGADLPSASDGEQYQVLQLDADLEPVWDWVRYVVPSE